MKTIKKLTALLLFSTITFSTFIKAEEVNIPVISRPAILQEGTQRELTTDQIAELLPWAKDSKSFLSDLVSNTDDMTVADKVERLTDGIKQVVDESSSKNSELFMRYVLNRALVINDILSTEMDSNTIGTIDAKARVLLLSISMAIKYYDVDMAKLKNSKMISPFAKFGIEYFGFLTELNKSIFNASAEYKIERTSLEWLQWDLYRDLTNASFAPQIVKINNALKTFPTRKLTDAQSINYVRQMKKIIVQLNLNIPTHLGKNSNDGITIFGDDLTLRKNDLVIYGNEVRIVEYITDDGKVSLREDSSHYPIVVTSNGIQKIISSFENLNISDFVLFGNSVRKIQYLGSRGRIVLAEDSGHYVNYVDYNNVSKSVTSFEKFKVGNKVFYNNQVRVIEYLDVNGRVVLKEDNVHYQDFAKCSELSLVIN